MFEERARILAIIWPLRGSSDLITLSPGEAASHGGEVERKNLHAALIVRSFSDFSSNEIQRAFAGIKSGKRSAHSITETPSPEK